MTISEAANRVLSILEQTDEEEYTHDQAMRDINQAIAEIADDSELSSYNTFSQFVVETDEYANDDGSFDPPSAWSDIPGWETLSSVLGSPDGRIGYIKKIWLDTDGANSDFDEARVDYLLSKYGDAEGQPKHYSVDGDRLYWRPVGAAGTSYTMRLWWAQVPPEYVSGDEPSVLSKAPYAVIYRACSLGSLWTQDDQAALKFDKKAQILIDKYTIRDSMHGDGRVTMEDFNG